MVVTVLSSSQITITTTDATATIFTFQKSPVPLASLLSTDGFSFSLAILVLPCSSFAPFPEPKLTSRINALSPCTISTSPPRSPILPRTRLLRDCLELCLLRRGDPEWCWYQCYNPIFYFRETMSVIHHQGAFHFLDVIYGAVIFDDEMKNWSRGIISRDDEDKNRVIYNVKTNIRFDSESNEIKSDLVCSVSMSGTITKELRSVLEMKSVLEIEQANCISICGTLISKTDCVYRLIRHEMLSIELEIGIGWKGYGFCQDSIRFLLIKLGDCG